MGEISRVGVIGAGLMGSGIAEVAARAGMDVRVTEVNQPALDAGRKKIEGSMARAVSRGKLSEEDQAAALSRLSYTTDLTDFADRDLIIEAIAENEQLKLEVFGALDKIGCGPNTIFASNTSSIPIMKLGMATTRPEQVVGIHFFNPVPVLKLVELIPSLLTSDETIQTARSFASNVMGKIVIRSQDRAGFVVNALLIPYILSAIRMLESGFASVEDIDNGSHRIISFGEPVPSYLGDINFLERLGRTEGNPRRAALKVNAVYGMMQAARAGIGIAMIPDYVAEHESSLERVLTGIEIPSYETYFVYPPALKNSKRVGVFRDFLVAKAREWSF